MGDCLRLVAGEREWNLNLGVSFSKSCAFLLPLPAQEWGGRSRSEQPQFRPSIVAESRLAAGVVLAEHGESSWSWGEGGVG